MVDKTVWASHRSGREPAVGGQPLHEVVPTLRDPVVSLVTSSGQAQPRQPQRGFAVVGGATSTGVPKWEKRSVSAYVAVTNRGPAAALPGLVSVSE